MEACDFTAKTCSSAWGRVRVSIKMIFHRRADQRKYFLMVQFVV